MNLSQDSYKLTYDTSKLFFNKNQTYVFFKNSLFVTIEYYLQLLDKVSEIKSSKYSHQRNNRELAILEQVVVFGQATF